MAHDGVHPELMVILVASELTPLCGSPAGATRVIRDATASRTGRRSGRSIAQIVRAADTFSYDPAIGEDAAREMWMVPPPGRTTVAIDDDGTIVGTANMFANRPGPGDHVASGNYMVAARSSRRRHRAGTHRGLAALGARGRLPRDAVQRGGREQHTRRPALRADGVRQP